LLREEHWITTLEAFMTYLLPTRSALPMSPANSVTQWLDRLKAGDRDAAEKLWQRYFQRLVDVARGKLRGARLARDEEDVALSALVSLFEGAVDGRFPQLKDRNGLWPLLVTITARKASKVLRHERCRMRGAGRVRGGSALVGLADPDMPQAFDQIIGRAPTPDFIAQVAEECRRLMERLGDDELRALAAWKMEGFTNVEIAAKLGCSRLTVQRRLRLIRRMWEEGVSHE
jgi:DNA-directed RNA polymerase specialized sigma24 family protein